MESLQSVIKAGPAVMPLLVEALKNGSPSTREFAAQALVLVADPSARSALEQTVADSNAATRMYAIQALSMLGPLALTEQYERILQKDPSFYGVRPMLAAALARDDKPDAAGLRKMLLDYDLAKLDSARLGEMAPDFTLADFTGKTQRLSEFRGKKTVVLRFILFDF
ncbi:MAG: HEAT repeat domain-containing protein [Gemmataceae bacterium]|nr:HEAT repeat domain-containing protein [Gemmataceae bacterium]